MSWFPFDEQECRLKFGSWTYHNASIDVNISERSNNSAAYEARDQTELGNKTFEQWYIMAPYEYEKNGVSKAIFFLYE